MRWNGGLLVSAVFLMFFASTAAAAQGEPRMVQGRLAWAPGGDGTPFIVVQADDGRYYVADLSGAQRRGAPVNVGDRVSLAGVEGARPWQVSALVFGSGDSAVAALDAPSASPPTAAAPPTDRPEAPSRPWRQIRGTVDSVSDTTIRLRGADGRQVTVDVSRLGASLRPGDRATVFVVPEDGQRLVAVGFIQSGSATR